MKSLRVQGGTPQPLSGSSLRRGWVLTGRHILTCTTSEPAQVMLQGWSWWILHVETSQRNAKTHSLVRVVFKRLAVLSINSLCTEAVIIVHVKSRLNMINQIKSKREAKPFWWHHRRGRVLDQDGSWWFLLLYWGNPQRTPTSPRASHPKCLSALFSGEEQTTWRPYVFVSAPRAKLWYQTCVF